MTGPSLLQYNFMVNVNFLKKIIYRIVVCKAQIEKEKGSHISRDWSISSLEEIVWSFHYEIINGVVKIAQT